MNNLPLYLRTNQVTSLLSLRFSSANRLSIPLEKGNYLSAVCCKGFFFIGCVMTLTFIAGKLNLFFNVDKFWISIAFSFVH